MALWWHGVWIQYQINSLIQHKFKGFSMFTLIRPSLKTEFPADRMFLVCGYTTIGIFSENIQQFILLKANYFPPCMKRDRKKKKRQFKSGQDSVWFPINT